MSELINRNIADFLSLPRLPGRLTLPQAAALLGVGEHDMAILIKTELIKPLAKPEPNAPKFFSATAIVEMAGDPVKIDKVARAIAKNWRKKNDRQLQRQSSEAVEQESQ